MTTQNNKVLIFTASSGKNLELSKKVSNFLSTKSFEPEIVDISSLNLPLYSSLTSKDDTPTSIEDVVEKMKKVENIFFFAAEYNGGLPPSLTNFLAWMSVSSKDWREHFNGKTAIIGTHSGSGGLHALMALRVQLAYIGMNVLGRQIHTHFKKELNLEALESIVNSL